jgi:hypothetical protein
MRAGFGLPCFPQQLFLEGAMREGFSLRPQALCLDAKALFERYDLFGGTTVQHDTTSQVSFRARLRALGFLKCRVDESLSEDDGGNPRSGGTGSGSVLIQLYRPFPARGTGGLDNLMFNAAVLHRF